MGLFKLMADALGVDEKEEAMAEALMELMGDAEGMGEEERAGMMARFVRRAFSPEMVGELLQEAANTEPGEPEETVTASAPSGAPPTDEKAQLAAEVEQLQGEKADAQLSDVADGEEKKAMKARFAALRKAAGFQLAFDSLKSEVELWKKAQRLQGEQEGIRRAPRPKKLGRQGTPLPGAPKPVEDVEEAGNRLVKAGIAMGFQTKKA